MKAKEILDKLYDLFKAGKIAIGIDTVDYSKDYSLYKDSDGFLFYPHNDDVELLKVDNDDVVRIDEENLIIVKEYEGNSHSYKICVWYVSKVKLSEL